MPISLRLAPLPHQQGDMISLVEQGPTSARGPRQQRPPPRVLAAQLAANERAQRTSAASPSSTPRGGVPEGMRTRPFSSPDAD
eukprot:771895-Pleurochrysis_carterae.AAC.1